MIIDEKLEKLQKLGAARPDLANDRQQEYLEEIRSFLRGQDFLRLGHNLSAGQWNSVMMGIRRMRETCKRLGITCFDRWLAGISESARNRNREAGLQIMAQVTAKRVQLITCLAEEEKPA